MIRVKSLMGFGMALVLLSSTAWAEKKSERAALLDHYLAIQSSLAGDSTEGVKKAALRVASAASKTPGMSSELAKEARKAALAVAKAKDLAQARTEFKKLSKPVVSWVESARPEGVEIAYCSMAGAKWVQKKGKIHNPYFGKQMLMCGEKV